MGGILRGLKIIRLIMTPNQNEYVPVPLLHCRICNVLVRIRIRNPNPAPDPDPPQKGGSGTGSATKRQSTGSKETLNIISKSK
jgi:hypothetical protein